MRQVRQAEPFRYGAMGSLGNASGMIIRQYNFPWEYQEDELLQSSDHDRIISWQPDRWEQTIRKFKPKNKGYTEWFQQEKPRKLLDFLAEIMKFDSNENVKWTGFRILGTVHRSNGNPIYTFQLFARKKGSTTEVYSGLHRAPNIQDTEEFFLGDEYGLTYM